MTTQPDELQPDGTSHTTVSVQDDQEQQSRTGSRYAKEELLSLRPIEDVTPHSKKSTATVAAEEKLEEVKSMALEEKLEELKPTAPEEKLEELKPTVHDEKLEEAKPEQLNNASQAESLEEDPDDDIPEELAEKKKKKKKSSGKNRQPPATGFEGESFYVTCSNWTLISSDRVLR